MTNQEILDDAPDWADTYCKHLQYPETASYTDNARDDKLDRSLADIKRIVELETHLIKIRELLAEQKDKSCLGTGYPTTESECAPWSIVDEVVNDITKALEDNNGN